MSYPLSCPPFSSLWAFPQGGGAARHEREAEHEHCEHAESRDREAVARLCAQHPDGAGGHVPFARATVSAREDVRDRLGPGRCVLVEDELLGACPRAVAAGAVAEASPVPIEALGSWNAPDGTGVLTTRAGRITPTVGRVPAPAGRVSAPTGPRIARPARVAAGRVHLGRSGGGIVAIAGDANGGVYPRRPDLSRANGVVHLLSTTARALPGGGGCGVVAIAQHPDRRIRVDRADLGRPERIRHRLAAAGARTAPGTAARLRRAVSAVARRPRR